MGYFKIVRTQNSISRILNKYLHLIKHKYLNLNFDSVNKK